MPGQLSRTPEKLRRIKDVAQCWFHLHYHRKKSIKSPLHRGDSTSPCPWNTGITVLTVSIKPFGILRTRSGQMPHLPTNKAFCKRKFTCKNQQFLWKWWYKSHIIHIALKYSEEEIFISSYITWNLTTRFRNINGHAHNQFCLPISNWLLSGHFPNEPNRKPENLPRAGSTLALHLVISCSVDPHR